MNLKNKSWSRSLIKLMTRLVGCTTRKEVNNNTIEKLIMEYNEILKISLKDYENPAENIIL